MAALHSTSHLTADPADANLLIDLSEYIDYLNFSIEVDWQMSVCRVSGPVANK